MSHEYRMEQLRAAIAAARKNFKKDANFFVVGLTYGCLMACKPQCLTEQPARINILSNVVASLRAVHVMTKSVG